MTEAWRSRFFGVITDVRAVPDALESLEQEDPGVSHVLDWLHATSEARAHRCLAIYSAMRRSRLHDVLAEDYQKLRAFIGNDAFESLVRDYLAERPSRSATLHYLGEAIPGHLEVHDYGSLRADLSDLARLEWARVVVAYDANVAGVTLDALAATPPDERVALRFTLVPAVRLVDLEHAADELWVALDRGDANPPVCVAAPRTVLVYRHSNDFLVRHRAVETAERDALRRVAAGHATLAEIGEPFSADEVDVEAAATRTWGAIRQWINDGILQLAVCAP